MKEYAQLCTIREGHSMSQTEHILLELFETYPQSTKGVLQDLGVVEKYGGSLKRQK